MCNTQKNSLLLNQHNGDDAPQKKKKTNNCTFVNMFNHILFFSNMFKSSLPPSSGCLIIKI